MRALLLRLLLAYCFIVPFASAAEMPIRLPPVPSTATADCALAYYWKAAPVGDTAQMLTLFCRACAPQTPTAAAGDLPLVAVLRDTLGDYDPVNDRITYVWLLGSPRPTIKQRVLSSVPFFYWRLSDKPLQPVNPKISPLLNLSAPQHPVFSNFARNLIQWTLLDPIAMPVRASSRAYRANSLDNERMYIEEAITFLRNAPVSSSPEEITPTQLQTVLARLQLRKQPLGGLVTKNAIAPYQEQADTDRNRVRARNWELLRQCAEKTGLYFEPLPIAETTDSYAMLWYSTDRPLPASGTGLRPVWKLLNIRDPRESGRLTQEKSKAFTRSLDADGSLLPADQQGSSTVKLIPLGVYNLNYPKVPLLVLDFNDDSHLRHHEVLQRGINEITAGVIGISHFTNWYYYVAADAYNFVVSRHGTAMDQSARLDCYAQFRADLFHDRKLDDELRNDLQIKVDRLAINPMEVSSEREMEVAEARYAALAQVNSAAHRSLLSRLDKDRRAELATYSESPGAQLGQSLLHAASLGLYTHRARPDGETLVSLDHCRRAQYQIDFLDALVLAGTQPEVSYRSERIQASISDLGALLPGMASPQMRAHVAATLASVRTLTHDAGIQSDCTLLLASMDRAKQDSGSPEHPIVAMNGIALAADSLTPAPQGGTIAVSSFK